MMTRKRPDSADPPEGLGVVVHGPVVLARAQGIAVGLRCIFGYPSGLSLPTVLRAQGVQAEAASRYSFHRSLHRGYPRPDSSDPWSGQVLSVDIDGRLQVLHPIHEEASGGEDTFDQEATYWVDKLPRDGKLGLIVGWPRAGLPETRVMLTLSDLDNLAERVLPLA
jgi:hypothetical protein